MLAVTQVELVQQAVDGRQGVAAIRGELQAADCPRTVQSEMVEQARGLEGGGLVRSALPHELIPNWGLFGGCLVLKNGLQRDRRIGNGQGFLAARTLDALAGILVVGPEFSAAGAFGVN